MHHQMLFYRSVSNPSRTAHETRVVASKNLKCVYVIVRSLCTRYNTKAPPTTINPAARPIKSHRPRLRVADAAPVGLAAAPELLLPLGLALVALAPADLEAEPLTEADPLAEGPAEAEAEADDELPPDTPAREYPSLVHDAPEAMV